LPPLSSQRALHPSQALPLSDHPLAPVPALALALLAQAPVEAELVLLFYHIRQTLE